MLKLQFPNLNFAPPDSVTPEISSKIPTPKTADDINDLFKTIDDEKPEIKEPKIKEDKEVKEDDKDKDEDDKDDDLELIDPEEDIEKLDLAKSEDDINIDAPPRKKEILKEYPELFKKFPFLEKIMFRDREYTEMFGSFDDAKELVEKSEIFNQFESQLLSGDTKEILRNVKDTDKRAFDTIVDDYLPALAEVDKEAYFHVVGNLNKRLIMEMVQEANDTNNDDLKQAALLVNQFVFGTAKFTAPTLRVEKKDDVEKSEAEQERLSFTKERFETARDDLQSQVDNTLRATISDYIDPKGNMSSYVKKNAVADAMRFLGESIASDSSVVRNLDKLWRASFDSKFNKDSLGKIKSFSPKREKEVEEKEEVEDSPRQRRTIVPGRPSQLKGKTNGPAKGESVSDFFMRD